MMKLLITAFVAASLLLSAGAFSADAKQLIEKAEATRLLAAKAGYEWTMTEALIVDAKKALAEGDETLAISLAKKALKQGENSLAQAEFSEGHWQHFEPK
jgi:hypothetical protein